MMDINEIMTILPHRYPFLLIDKVLEMEKGKTIIALKNLTANETFFQGHFPGEPVMPGVLEVEAMAQAGAVSILSLDEYKGKTAYFGAIDKAKFKNKVRPGDTLIIKVEIVKLKKVAGIGKGTAYIYDGSIDLNNLEDNLSKLKIASQAEITFIIG